MAGLIILAICASVLAAVMAWKMWRMKKEVYQFAEHLEENLDNIISGKEMISMGETEDSLWGKVNEKLLRTAHIWERKEQKSIKEKKEIKELISDISHQTKTPIANQKVYLEILSQEAMSDHARGFLKNLEGQTNRLDFLLQSLVKMSRLEAGVIRIQKKDTDLRYTLGRAVEAVVPSASGKQISLFVECGEDIGISHDEKWTEEAIFNILDNAVKYTPKGGEVRIKVSAQDILTQISIRDNGRGIPAERQAQIFTRFYREPEVREQDGIGIGLYLARKIIELQNGYIEVLSEHGRGSDFRIFLPNN